MEESRCSAVVELFTKFPPNAENNMGVKLQCIPQREEKKRMDQISYTVNTQGWADIYKVAQSTFKYLNLNSLRFNRVDEENRSKNNLNHIKRQMRRFTKIILRSYVQYVFDFEIKIFQ